MRFGPRVYGPTRRLMRRSSAIATRAPRTPKIAKLAAQGPRSTIHGDAQGGARHEPQAEKDASPRTKASEPRSGESHPRTEEGEAYLATVRLSTTSRVAMSLFGARRTCRFMPRCGQIQRVSRRRDAAARPHDPARVELLVDPATHRATGCRRFVRTEKISSSDIAERGSSVQR